MYSRDFRLLSYLVAVVDAGSLTAAARKLNVSTPVVSQALTDLEASVGYSLLTRGRGKLALTDSGKKVYGPAAEMVLSAELAMRALDPPAGKISGTLAVTMPTEISASWLPQLYADFRAEFPGVEVRVDARDEIIALENSENDIAVRAERSFRSAKPGRPAKLGRPAKSGATNHLVNLPLALVVSPSLDLPKGGSLRNTLARIPCIRFAQSIDGSSIRAVNLRTRRTEILPVDPVFQVNNGIVAKELACKGLGAALLIATSVAQQLASGDLIHLSEHHDFGHASVSFVFRDRFPTPQAQAFIDFCRAQFAG